MGICNSKDEDEEEENATVNPELVKFGLKTDEDLTMDKLIKIEPNLLMAYILVGKCKSMIGLI